MKSSIYLDHAATTPIHPEVRDTFVNAVDTIMGNPSSIYAVGREARKHLDDARKIVAQSIHAEPAEIIFTSGGTEADNLAIFGTVEALKNKGKHIITTQIEHHAVLNPCKKLMEEGFDVTFLPVNENGYINVEQVKEALRADTILVSIMYGNNEVGTIQPIEEIGQLLAGHQALFHTDAVQVYGVLPIDVQALQVDLLTVSGHKINSPRGTGFLYQRQSIVTKPTILGGEQERKRRAGTENVVAHIALAKAVAIAQETMAENKERYAQYASIFFDVFKEKGIAFERNGGELVLPHIVNVSFSGIDIESFLVNLDLEGIAASSGSACTAGSLDPSHVLTAMFGKESPKLRNSVRFSFGYGLDASIIREAAERIATVVQRLVK